jgi:hypothetical protein
MIDCDCTTLQPIMGMNSVNIGMEKSEEIRDALGEHTIPLSTMLECIVYVLNMLKAFITLLSVSRQMEETLGLVQGGDGHTGRLGWSRSQSSSSMVCTSFNGDNLHDFVIDSFQCYRCATWLLIGMFYVLGVRPIERLDGLAGISCCMVMRLQCIVGCADSAIDASPKEDGHVGSRERITHLPLGWQSDLLCCQQHQCPGGPRSGCSVGYWGHRGMYTGWHGDVVPDDTWKSNRHDWCCLVSNGSCIVSVRCGCVPSKSACPWPWSSPA